MKYIKIISLLFVVLLFAACAKSPFDHMEGVTETKKPDGSVVTQYGPGEYQEDATDKAIDGCRAWADKKGQEEAKQFSTLTGNEKTIAVMHRETMSMVKNVFGKGNIDPCSPGTNQWDAYIVYATEHNKTVRDVSKNGFSTVSHIATVTGVVKAVDAVAGKIGDQVAGDKTTAGRDLNEAGGSNELVGNTDTDEEIHSTNTATQVTDDNGTQTIEAPQADTEPEPKVETGEETA